MMLALKDCPYLEWVVIGKNIKSVGSYAFKKTPKLTKIKFMGVNVVSAENAFSGAGKKKEAKLTIISP